MGLLFFNNIIASIKIIFLNLPLGFSSPISTFLFNKGILFKGHLVNNFAPCSDLSIYNLLAMTIGFVCEAYIQKYFNIWRLYPIRIPFQTF